MSYLGYTQWAIARDATDVRAMAMLVTMSNFAGMTYAGDSLMLENAMGWTSMMARMASTPVWRMIVGRLLGLDRIKPKQWRRSEEHTSELQSLMRISYAVFCLKKKNTNTNKKTRRLQ